MSGLMALACPATESEKSKEQAWPLCELWRLGVQDSRIYHTSTCFPAKQGHTMQEIALSEGFD